MKKKVLIMAGYYLPSVKGGGPIQSIKNMVDNLSDKIEFYIVASDRDLGEDKPFDNLDVDKWVNVGKANVYYTNIAKLNWSKTANIINNSECRILYLNSFFDYKFTTVPILLKKINKLDVDKIILAPRGQFSPGALSLKSFKKKLFIRITKILGFYNNITWHATADSEKKDIQSIFGDAINILIANNLTENYKNLLYDKDLKKNTGELKIVFISRVHPKKNLMKAIELLKAIRGEVTFNIYGPIEDKVYWNKCERVMDSVPPNIKVSYQGVVKHSEIMDIFKSHHVFFFPTLGENFGHVISEALIGGCPVIISDQTPWLNLENIGVGWDIDLENYKKFIEVIQHCVYIDNNEYQNLSRNAFKYSKEVSNQKNELIKTLNLFNN